MRSEKLPLLVVFPESRASDVSDTSLSPLVLVSYPFIDRWGCGGGVIRLPVGFSKPHTCTPLKSDKCQNLTVGEACVDAHPLSLLENHCSA